MAYEKRKIFKNYVEPSCVPGCECLVAIELFSKLSEMYDRVSHGVMDQDGTWTWSLDLESECKLRLLDALEIFKNDLIGLT